MQLNSHSFFILLRPFQTNKTRSYEIPHIVFTKLVRQRRQTFCEYNVKPIYKILPKIPEFLVIFNLNSITSLITHDINLHSGDIKWALRAPSGSDPKAGFSTRYHSRSGINQRIQNATRVSIIGRNILASQQLLRSTFDYRLVFFSRHPSCGRHRARR